ncbi:hypothetical protein BH09ACT5_BH09ACT5_06600 [soil metagenome]
MSTVAMGIGVMGAGVSGTGSSRTRPAGHASAPKLRLTKRGRAVLTFLVATPLVAAAFLFVLNGGGATASLEGSNVPFEYVTVEPGQSLWQLAEELAPQSDPREVIAELVQFNQLSGPDVYAGQELAVPSSLH